MTDICDSRLDQRPLGAVGVAMLLLGSLVGCARHTQTVVTSPPPPPVFTQTPSLAELTAAVNRTQVITQLSTNSASVDVTSMTAVPKLNATVNLEREKRFRLRANLPLMMGTGLDLGSNEQEFWFEVPEGMSMTQTMYYAAHSDYARILDRAILPVDPTWLMDAMGLVQLDPNQVLVGPVVRSDGLLEVRSGIQTPAGQYQRVVFIEPSAGYLTHLFLYAPDGRLVATSHTSDHRYYESVNCVLPHRINLELIPQTAAPLAMELEVGSWAINQLLSGDPEVFARPTSAKSQVNLVQLSGTGMPMGGPVPTGAAAYSAGAGSGLPLRGTRLR
ncbi:MAG: hypothetical protein AAGD07_02800 [Planctomycetota bacterium]